MSDRPSCIVSPSQVAERQWALFPTATSCSAWDTPSARRRRSRSNHLVIANCAQQALFMERLALPDVALKDIPVTYALPSVEPVACVNDVAKSGFSLITNPFAEQAKTGG